MPIKKTVTKEEFEKLNKDFQELYIENDGSYELDVDGAEDVGALKRAKEHEVNRRKKATDELHTAKEALSALQEEYDAYKSSNTKDNVKDVETRLTEKHKKDLTALQTKLEASKKFIEKKMIDDASDKLASELMPNAPKVMLPHIKGRLGIEYDGDTPNLVVFDEKNTNSGMNLEDLKKSFVENKDFADIIKVNKASGSGLNGNNSKAVPKNVKDLNATELLALASSNPQMFESYTQK